MTNLWIDLTDMMVWKGNFTGIQRVTYEYAQRFNKDGVKFCAYDAVDDRFIEINLDLIDRIISNDENDAAELVTFRKKMRLLLGKPYYALPDRYKMSLSPLVGRANHTVRYIMSKTIAKSRHITSPYAHFPEALFLETDKVFIIGAGWNEQRALQKLVMIKTERDIQIIQHINDILPIYQPQLFAEELPLVFAPYIDLAIRNSSMITVISEATRRDIKIYCKEHSITLPQIEVIRLGDDPKLTTSKKPEAIKSGEKFVLALGTFEVRKNYVLLYQALKLAQIEQRDLPKIVIAGRRGWLSSDIIYTMSHDPYTRERLVWLDDAPDDEVAWLFNNCMFTVFPSIAEGWGLPVAESLGNGKLCLVSGVSSMLEIGEGLVDYFLPYDARECMEKMQYYIAEDRYIVANEKVKNNYKIFTWDESYKKLVDAINKITT